MMLLELFYIYPYYDLLTLSYFLFLKVTGCLSPKNKTAGFPCL